MSHILYPTTNLNSTEEIKFSRGKDIYLFDQENARYLDGMAGLWCSALGHGNQELIEAIKEQYQTLSFSHMFGGKTHQPGIDLANKLNTMLPVENAKIFFGNSGSDANDSLVKIVRYYNQVLGRPKKTKIISRKNAYHGVTLASTALTGLTSAHQNFDIPFDALGIIRIDAPHYYRNAYSGEAESSYCDRLISQLEDTINSEGAENIAAFISEPINGAGGVIVPPKNYFERVQVLLNENDILLLDDEVICAFGRTGNDFGSTTFNFKPDTMTLAKGLSSAYFPISALGISGDIYEKLVEGSSEVGMFGHGYTYSGHPVGCVAALKTIEIYEREQLFSRAKKLGVYLHKKLKDTFKDNQYLGEIRGQGLIAGLEFVSDQEKKTPFDNNLFATRCQQKCQENGLIIRALANNTLAICPPLIITENQIDELVFLLNKSVLQVIQQSFAKSAHR